MMLAHKIQRGLRHFALLLLVFMAACSVSDNHSVGPNESPDDDTQIGDGGSFNPSEGGNVQECETENDDGTCEEPTENSDIIRLASTSFDFGINELAAIECTEVSIPGGLSYAAEFDAANTSTYDEDSDGDGTTDGTTYQFAFGTGTDSYSTARVSGTGTLTLCYLRKSKGQHAAQVKLVLTGADTTTAGYAYVLKLSGQTMEKVFTITSPSNYQVVHENENEGVNTDEDEYLLTASGSVNVTELSSIFKDGMSTPVIVNVDGVLFGTYFDTSGGFSTTIGVSRTPGVYPVEFSIETNKDMVITEKLYVVVMSAPALKIEVRDNGGNEINSLGTTDASTLVVGVNVSNLIVSGPTTDHTAKVTSLLWNGQPLGGSTQGQELYYGQEEEVNWCLDEAGSAFAGFDGTTTYCVPLATITDLMTGANTIQATVENELGSVTSDFTLVLDNTRPTVSLSSPKENQLFDVNEKQLVISGTIKNFAPLDVSSWDIISAARESASASTDSESSTANSKIVIGDDGSGWCMPDATDGSDTGCPVSSVKLWLNTSIYKTPIYIYPATAYDGLNATELNAQVGDPDGDGNYTSGHCYINTGEELTVFEPATDATTTTDASGNIVTTTSTTDSSGVTTTVTTTTNKLTGEVTQATTVSSTTSTDDPTKLVSEFDEDDGYTTTVTTDAESGDVSSQVHDAQTDSTTYTTTDAKTGEIVQYTEQRVCNITQGTFKVVLDFPSDKHEFVYNLYSNIVEIRATSISEHSAIKVASFQRGINKAAAYDSASKDLTAGDLGTINESGSVDRAPIMLDLSEQIIKNADVIKVVEKLLNEQFNFADLANGGPLPKNDDDEIDLDADFKKEYQKETGEEYDGNFLDLSSEWQKKYIWWNLHATMPQKFLALKRYRQLKALGADTLDELQDMNTAEIMFKDPKDNPDLTFEEPENQTLDNYDIAGDACYNRITTAFMNYSDFYNVYKPIYTEMGSDDAAIKTRILMEDVWPDEVAKNSDGSVAYDWQDTVQGRWVVEKLELKTGGKIDADICLVPSDSITTGCDEEDFEYYGKEPAFWGHVAGMPLINGGITGIENDPAIPLIWSVGKLRLKLEDIISLKKIPLQKDNELTGSYSNYLDIDASQIEVDKSNISITWETNDISIKPYIYCKEYYHARYDASANGSLRTPLGCGDYPMSVTEEEGKGQYTSGYPLALEVNSPAGIIAEELMSSGGENKFLLTIVWNELSETFKEILSCMDTEQVNPLLNPDAFPYPAWIPDGKRFSMAMAVDLVDGEISIVDQDEAVNKLAYFDINISEADLVIDDDSAYFGIPFSMGISDVHGFGTARTRSKGAGSNFSFSTNIKPANDMAGVIASTYTQANTTGHLVRETVDNGLSSRWQNADHSGMTMGASLNLEELVNSLMFLVFQKGPMSLLDDFEVEGLSSPDGYTIGIDKVIFGRMEICNDLADKLLSTDLPPGILFTDIAGQFTAPAIHLDVSVAKNYPVTLALTSIDETTNTTEIKVGINNLQISARNLYSILKGDTAYYFYEKEDWMDDTSSYDYETYGNIGEYDFSEVVRVRADIVLGLKIIYHPEEQIVNVFVEGRDEQNIHLSVINPGTSYDDSVVVATLYDLLNNVFNKLSASYDTTPSGDITTSFSVSLKPNSDGRISVVGLNDLEVEAKMAESANGECTDSNTPYYVSEVLDSTGTKDNGPGVIQDGPGSIKVQPAGSLRAQGFTLSKFSSIMKEKLKPAMKKLSGPTELMRKNLAMQSQTVIKPGPLTVDEGAFQDKIEAMDDPCYFLTLDDSTDNDNAIKDSLCDFGIEDVYIDPLVEFDNENGYIHLSTELWLDLYDWIGSTETE